MYLDIPSPETYIIAVLASLLTDTPITVRRIFEDNHNWEAFRLAEKGNLRDVEINEVNKMLSCKDESRGFFIYRCKHCGTTLIVHFGCNSRICSNCGKNHTDKWARSLQNALFNVPHRHAVLIIPDALWPVVRNNCFLMKVLMDAAITAINDTISYKHLNGRLTAGAVVVLHPFSKQMGFNPHLHILVTEGGFDRRDKFVHQKYIPFNAMRKTWQCLRRCCAVTGAYAIQSDTSKEHSIFDTHRPAFQEISQGILRNAKHRRRHSYQKNPESRTKRR